MKWFLEQYDSIIVMTLLGFIGGIVKVCNDPSKHTWKQNISSLLVSAFSGMMTAMLFHKYFSDPLYFGAVCAMAGYMGQIVLYKLGTMVQNAIGIADDLRDKKN